MGLNIETRDNAQVARRAELDRYPDECPICHHHIEPKLAGASHYKHGVTQRVEVVLRCPRHECQRLFIARYHDGPSRTLDLHSVAPVYPVKPEHPETITKLSPSFVEIYRQAAHAESISLMEIAGIGYRKALEFLIKDFAIHEKPDNKEKIEKAFLGNVIKDYIDDVRVKQSAERATWLGNDEAHYVRKWETKDIDLGPDFEVSLELD